MNKKPLVLFHTYFQHRHTETQGARKTKLSEYFPIQSYFLFSDKKFLVVLSVLSALVVLKPYFQSIPIIFANIHGLLPQTKILFGAYAELQQQSRTKAH
jgi:hypothetical protein